MRPRQTRRTSWSTPAMVDETTVMLNQPRLSSLFRIAGISRGELFESSNINACSRYRARTDSRAADLRFTCTARERGLPPSLKLRRTTVALAEAVRPAQRRAEARALRGNRSELCV